MKLNPTKEQIQIARRLFTAITHQKEVNTTATANSDIIDLENELIDVTYNIHKKTRENLSDLDRKQLLELLGKCFGSLVMNIMLDPKKIQLFDDSVTEQDPAKEGYADDKASFQKFSAFGMYFPIEQFLSNENRLHEIELFENVTGVIGYIPEFYIYRIQEDCSWQVPHLKPTTCLFAFINQKHELIESDDFPTIERLLFKEFLK